MRNMNGMDRDVLKRGRMEKVEGTESCELTKWNSEEWVEWYATKWEGRAGVACDGKNGIEWEELE